jgi:hypothetical protein
MFGNILFAFYMERYMTPKEVFDYKLLWAIKWSQTQGSLAFNAASEKLDRFLKDLEPQLWRRQRDSHARQDQDDRGGGGKRKSKRRITRKHKRRPRSYKKR